MFSLVPIVIQQSPERDVSRGPSAGAVTLATRDPGANVQGEGVRGASAQQMASADFLSYIPAGEGVHDGGVSPASTAAALGLRLAPHVLGGTPGAEQWQVNPRAWPSTPEPLQGLPILPTLAPVRIAGDIHTPMAGLSLRDAVPPLPAAVESPPAPAVEARMHPAKQGCKRPPSEAGGVSGIAALHRKKRTKRPRFASAQEAEAYTTAASCMAGQL